MNSVPNVQGLKKPPDPIQERIAVAQERIADALERIANKVEVRF